MKAQYFALFLGLVLATPGSFAAEPQQEIALSITRILDNLGDPQVSRGAVIASPSKTYPEYYFHWTRDAGLTMASLMSHGGNFPGLGQILKNWSVFEKLAQKNSMTAGGLGEPKFFVDGRVFDGPWGRPQNDGPAIRSWAYLRAFGTPDEFVHNDLEYLRAHWQEPSIDLWEEVRGNHFFTRYSQMNAFRTAAWAYLKNNQRDQASLYAAEADKVESSLAAFIDTGRMLVLPTVGNYQGLSKPAGLDISVLLAVLYFGPTQRWSLSQSYILSTAARMEEAFRNLYPINKSFPDMGPAIGRYPEDVYDGVGFSGGNPWFLSTFGMGEFYCTLAEGLMKQGGVRFDRVSLNFYRRLMPSLQNSPGLQQSQQEFWTLVQKLREKGQSYIQRALFHGGADRHYSEQFDGGNGYRRGARDLTWSYAASLRAHRSCDSASQFLARFKK